MTQFTAAVTIIADVNDEVQYVGDVGESEETAWRLCLGWPTAAEVIQRNGSGWYAAQATLTWERP